jgi:hypothetical protein
MDRAWTGIVPLLHEQEHIITRAILKAWLQVLANRLENKKAGIGEVLSEDLIQILSC